MCTRRSARAPYVAPTLTERINASRAANAEREKRNAALKRRDESLSDRAEKLTPKTPAHVVAGLIADVRRLQNDGGSVYYLIKEIAEHAGIERQIVQAGVDDRQ